MDRLKFFLISCSQISHLTELGLEKRASIKAP